MDKPWLRGLQVHYAPLDEKRSEMFLLATMFEAKGTEPVPEINNTFFVQVLQKRIDVLKLPISFTDPAKMAVIGLCDRVGAVPILLIDCLNAYEGKTVTVEMLTNLYPVGFYDEDSMMRIVEERLKGPDETKPKWAELY